MKWCAEGLEAFRLHRTTIELTVCFVPVDGGLAPGERRVRRRGPSGAATRFPVVRPFEQARLEYVPGAGMVQAPSPLRR